MNAEVHPGHDEFDPDEARLEALLRADAARDAYVEDAGFTLRVMSALPAPKRLRSYSWLGPALGGLAVAGVVCFSPVTAELLVPLKTLLNGHWMPLQSLLVFVPLIGLAYGTAWFATTDTA
jgi:hypothetical protein